MHRDGLRSPKQPGLFPDRAPSDARQGTVRALSPGRCPRCALPLDGHTCHVCASFRCRACQQWTANAAGNGALCYFCLV
jgi:hypothetical protein